MKMINVGCGRHFHQDWINLDLMSGIPGVLKYDLRQGLPFDEGECDVIYHSHLLEHLTHEAGRRFLCDCFRALKPGGILRVVVPDLEGIVRAYLASLQQAEESGDRDNLNWMRIELIDQMVRVNSGGAMKEYICSGQLLNRDFVESRLGCELLVAESKLSHRKTLFDRLCQLPKKVYKLRRHLALMLVTIADGKKGNTALREGYFRQSGEVHRWMYDRVSLCHLLMEIGFCRAEPCTAVGSQIPSFNQFELDAVAGQTRKPDSLFVEAVKPAIVERQAA